MAEVNRQDKQRWQFALLLLLLVPVFGGLFLLLPRSVNPLRAEQQQGSKLGRQLLQTASAASGDVHPFPKNYKVVGSVADRYTMAVDPETGQTVLHDAVGGVGTNSTSVEGDRLRLAREMISLDQYASEHQDALNPEDYRWLKNMAHTGMQLAFGVPGLSPSAQVPVKQSLLDEFHAISANPAGSLLTVKGAATLNSATQTPAAWSSTGLASVNTGLVNAASVPSGPAGSKSPLNLTTSITAPLVNTEPSLAVISTLGLSATLDLNVSGTSADTTLSLKPIPIAAEPSSTSINTAPLATSGSQSVTSLSTTVSTTTSAVSAPLTTTVQDYYNALLAPTK